MHMGHNCYISFKTEDIGYKEEIQKWKDSDKVDMIDKSLNTPINSEDEDYIMRKIREDYLSDSTVTIFLIGSYSAENLGWEEQRFIKRELQASLYNGEGNTRNGILGVVLPSMYNSIYRGQYTCLSCGENHNTVVLNDTTVIKELSAIPSIGGIIVSAPVLIIICFDVNHISSVDVRTETTSADTKEPTPV